MLNETVNDVFITVQCHYKTNILRDLCKGIEGVLLACRPRCKGGSLHVLSARPTNTLLRLVTSPDLVI